MTVDFTTGLELAMDNLHKTGAFLTVKSGNIINTMTISWGSIGFQWGKPTFSVMVRNSRYTHELLKNSKEFTVSIPLSGGKKTALSICGSKSGRDVDKFKEANIKMKASKLIETPVIAECGAYYECKILYSSEMLMKDISEEMKNRFYQDDDYHTLYFGEIVSCYGEEA